MRNIICSFLFVLFFSTSALAVVRITNMNDFAFGSWSGSGQLQATDAVCIHDSAANKNFGIRARGSGASFAFTIANGALTIPYTVEFQQGASAFVALTTNVRRSFTTGAHANQTCSGTTNANIRVTFSQANLEAATAGSYSGVLTIILTAT